MQFSQTDLHPVEALLDQVLGETGEIKLLRLANQLRLIGRRFSDGGLERFEYGFVYHQTPAFTFETSIGAAPCPVRAFCPG